MAPLAVSLSSRPRVAMMDCSALAFAAILRDLKILIRADFLNADEHVASPSLTPHILGMLSRQFRMKVD